MKTKTSNIIAATFAAALASVASAQIPTNLSGPSQFNDASAVNSVNYNLTLGAPGLNLYYASGSTALNAAVSSWSAVTSSGILGINWLAQGGTVKTIFIGESAGEKNDFGYIVSGGSLATVSNYKVLIADIDAPNNIQSGQEALVHYGAGEQVDFWLNNPGDYTVYGPQFQGGAYFSYLLSGVGAAFAGGDPYTHVKFKWVSVDTEYWNGSAFITGPVDTLLIAFEDLRGPAPVQGQIPPIDTALGDADYTDFIVAFQFLPSQAVPEPSTYGLMGAAALLGLVGYRRFKASKKAA